MCLQASRAGEHRKQVVDVASVVFGWDGERRGRARRLAIAPGNRAAAFGPAAEERQPRAQNRGLHLVEPAVGAKLVVAIPRGLPAVAQPLDPRRERGVAGDDRAAVAERAEVLRRIEAERTGDADRADWPSEVARCA